jgi:hypothetical protein
VQRETARGKWGWDFHIDGLHSVYASDFDNNGLGSADGFGTEIGTIGIAGMLMGWGVAITTTSVTTALPGTSNDTLSASTVYSKIAFAHEFQDQEWTVGAALTLGQFEVTRGSRLFTLNGSGLELGGLWRPPEQPWRAGVAVRFPISGKDVTVESCDPMNCEGYILPRRLEAPWRLALGFAWRFAETPWNQHVDAHYRDEKSLTVAADVVLTGSVPRSYDLEWWGAQELQRSGKNVSPSLRLGADYEILPGRLRVNTGTYYEPGRVADTHGRVHLTAGVELALFQITLWRWTYRPRFAATGDVAARYGNAGVSIGFWH